MSDLNFSDLESDFDAVATKGTDTPRHECGKCKGKGSVTFGYVNIRTGKCFACNGRGWFKTDEQTRRKGRESAAKSKAAKAESNIASFTQEQPAAAQWLSEAAGRNNDFATSLIAGIEKYGDLTPKQLSAVYNIIAKDEDRAKQREAAAANPTVVDLTPVFEKFRVAQEAGLKKPKLRLEGICFVLAKGRNAGSLYVKAGPAYEDTYLGKVSPEGVFSRSRDCSDVALQRLLDISKDVLEAAQAYGKVTGECSCCGRELTDPSSIELGIGPICADKWGFA